MINKNNNGRSKPFFHADHVGSFLRPGNLLEAWRRQENDEMTADEFRKEQNEAIREVVWLQEEVGLKAITDGEFRPDVWWSEFVAAIDGINVDRNDTSTPFQGNAVAGSTPYIPKRIRTAGKLRHPGDAIMGYAYEFLYGITKGTPKITLPAPSRLHHQYPDSAVDANVYPDIDEFWSDLASLYQREIAALEALGCNYIQLDDPIISLFVDDTRRAEMADMGVDLDTLLQRYVEVTNAATSQRAETTCVALHICRGNARGSWIASGGYERIANAVFPNLDVDTYLLEYDDERSGDFKPLALIPRDKRVVLGLISSKRSSLEPVAEIAARVEEAARFVAFENLAISPQCGFASVKEGNLIHIEDEIRKLRLVVDVAAELWGANAVRSARTNATSA